MTRIPQMLTVEQTEKSIEVFDKHADRWISKGQLKAAEWAIYMSNKLRVTIGMKPRETITVH